MSVRDTGTGGDFDNGFAEYERTLEAERLDRLDPPAVSASGGPISDESDSERMKEAYIEALAAATRLRAVLTQQEAALGKVQRAVFNAECALRSTLDRDDAVAIAIVNLTDAVDALAGVRSDG